MAADVNSYDAWFRAKVQAALEGRDDAPIVAPPPHTIAHQLFRWWIAQ